ncbi:MAG: radical SAM protein [Patescibacteria group bacterium]
MKIENKRSKKVNKKEIFLIEDRKRKILFMPFKGLVMEITEAEKSRVVELIKDPNFSFQDLLGLFPDIDENRLLSLKTEDNSNEEMKGFFPTSAVIFTTLNCHLRCVYCYSDAGKQNISMDWELAKGTIDFVIGNTKRSSQKDCSLEFHGGGEPTWNWPIFQSSIVYFNERAKYEHLNSEVSLVTNGMLSRAQIDWIIRHNMRSVQVSLDGTEDLQNFQRPTAGGNKSFATVCRAVRSFLNEGIKTTIHSVITEKGIERIPEIIHFFGENFSGATVQIEPASPCGRGLSTGQRFPSPESFIRGFIEAQNIAKSFDLDLIYSGTSSQLSDFCRGFCGVYVPNFVVTPEGFVTACHEVAELKHKFANFFIYGRWDHTKKKFFFNRNKIRKLRHSIDEIDPACDECFARPYCAGDCLVKTLNDTKKENDFSSSPRCMINRELTKYYIFNRLFGDKGGVR